MNITHIDQSVPLNRHLLDKWVKEQTKENIKPLEGITLLLIQHQLESQVPLVQAFIKLGLDPNNLYWIDIPYTSSERVRQAMNKSLKIPLGNFRNHSYHVLDKYSPYQIKRVGEIYKEFLSTKPNKLVVLDDGAYFLEAVSNFSNKLPAVAIVEQTSRGFIKIEDSKILQNYMSQIPIVDVARSKPKITFEPPFIGKSVCKALSRHIRGCRQFVKTPKVRCLLLGYGTIGQEVAKYLHEELEFEKNRIHVYDPRSDKQKKAKEIGFSCWNREELRQRFNVVVGCSGRQAFKLDDYIYLEDYALLASASSGTVELSREVFIEKADESDIDDISITREGLDESNVHSNITIKLIDRSATFVNGGFPVNFDGGKDCDSLIHLQPTRIMMLAGAIQAVKAIKNKYKGKLDLDSNVCNWFENLRKSKGSESHLLPKN
jgi:S-adenosylhomocysteine hydrolase